MEINLDGNCLHLGLAVKVFGPNDRLHEYNQTPIFKGLTFISPEKTARLRQLASSQSETAEAIENAHNSFRHRGLIDYCADHGVSPAIVMSDLALGKLGYTAGSFLIRAANGGNLDKESNIGLGSLECLPQNIALTPDFLALPRRKDRIEINMFVEDPEGSEEFHEVTGFRAEKPIINNPLVLIEPIFEPRKGNRTRFTVTW